MSKLATALALLVLSVVLGAMWLRGMRGATVATAGEQRLTLIGAGMTLAAAMAFAAAAFLSDA